MEEKKHVALVGLTISLSVILVFGIIACVVCFVVFNSSTANGITSNVAFGLAVVEDTMAEENFDQNVDDGIVVVETDSNNLPHDDPTQGIKELVNLAIATDELSSSISSNFDEWSDINLNSADFSGISDSVDSVGGYVKKLDGALTGLNSNTSTQSVYLSSKVTDIEQYYSNIDEKISNITSHGNALQAATFFAVNGFDIEAEVREIEQQIIEFKDYVDSFRMRIDYIGEERYGDNWWSYSRL